MFLQIQDDVHSHVPALGNGGEVPGYNLSWKNCTGWVKSFGNRLNLDFVYVYKNTSTEIDRFSSITSGEWLSGKQFPIYESIARWGNFHIQGHLDHIENTGKHYRVGIIIRRYFYKINLPNHLLYGYDTHYNADGDPVDKHSFRAFSTNDGIVSFVSYKYSPLYCEDVHNKSNRIYGEIGY